MITRAKYEQLLLQLTLFLIPANLAYHWYSDAAYVNGRLIDYLLPKLYLSDLTILFLVIPALMDSSFRQCIKNLLSPLLLIFLLFLTVNAAVSPIPTAGFWALFKVIEYLLFGLFLYHRYSRLSFFKLSLIPLAASILFQSVVSLYQYIQHRSVFGYTFLGEVDLKSIGIAKASFAGVLEVLPYGTTPHPNVLAGFVLISTLLFILCVRSVPNLRYKSILVPAVMSSSVLILMLTQSVSALSGAVLLLVLSILNIFLSTRIYRLLLLIVSISTYIISLLLSASLYHLPVFVDNHSIVARYELNRIAFSLFFTHPIVGVGLNQFAAHVPFSTFGSQRSLFLQPVHHAPLLLLAELGALGALLLAGLIISYTKTLNARLKGVNREAHLLLLPLIGLLYISAWDHYVLTLQTGQLLLTLALTLPLLSASRKMS